MSQPHSAARDFPGIDRTKIAEMLMKLFEHWSLTTEEQLDALGMSKDIFEGMKAQANKLANMPI